MAFKIIHKEFNNVLRGEEITAVLDNPNDLADLGAHYCPGSVAMVVDKGIPAYMLNASGEWKEI